MTRLDHFQDYWRHVNAAVDGGGPVLDLGMGMPPPDVFPAPAVLTAALHESIDAGDYNLYVRPEGERNCLEQIVAHENARLPAGAAGYDERCVMIVPGGIQAFSAIVSTLAPPGAPIVVPVPSYFSLTARSELHGPTVTVPCDEGRNFRADDVERALTGPERPGLMWFCQPNNPTGRYVPVDELARIVELAETHGCPLVLDESCDNYRFTDVEPVPASICSPSVVRIRTFSKEQNLAGYRLGYVLAAPEVVRRLTRVVPVLYGNPTVMATRAVTADLRARNGGTPRDDEHGRVSRANQDRMRAARDALLGALRSWDRVAEVVEPEACYYLFARFHHDGDGPSLFRALLERERLDVVPGVVFGAPQDEAWIRICFARTPGVLRDGLDRIGRVLS